MDQDDYKEHKKRIIHIFGSKYEISHKNNIIINNNYSIFIGIFIYKIKSLYSNFEFFRKSLIIIGSIIFIGLFIFANIDETIVNCIDYINNINNINSINNKDICYYNINNCYNTEYNILYKCIFELNKNELYLYGILHLFVVFLNICKIIFIIYLFVIFCEKFSLIINYLINISITKYNEYIPSIDNII